MTTKANNNFIIPLITMMIFIFQFLALIDTANADWVDDWVSQKTETSPGYFEGQKRGYLTGGAFSVRFAPQTNTNLFSVNAPSIKSGCGGIDVEMGGFSYMNFDHLVLKLQKMLANSPAVAFDLGLSTLCVQCSNAVKAFESLSSKLNSIQMDDCKASKVLVAKAFQAAGSDNAQVLAQAEGEFFTGAGVGDLWSDFTQKRETAPITPHTKMIETCPTTILSVLGTPNTTILDNLATLRGYPREYTPLMRGIVGDVEIREVATAIVALPIPPCEGNDENLINGFLSGNVSSRANATATCVKLQKTKNFRSWVNTSLLTILEKMQTKKPLTAQETTFLDKVPAPTYTVIKTVARSSGDVSLQASLNEIVAAGYARNMVIDFYQVIADGITQIEVLAQKESGGVSNTCKIDLFTPAIEQVRTLEVRLREKRMAVNQYYIGLLQEIEASTRFANRVQEVDIAITKEAVNQFKPALARKEGR